MIILPKLVLASASPRRAEILSSVGWKFDKETAEIDESVKENELPADYVCRLAREKAGAVAQNYSQALILGADTTVVIKGEIIGKPFDLADAARMLRLLSGNWHEVLTGVCLVRKSIGDDGQLQHSEVYGVETTRVKFAEMNDSEINFLVSEGAPLDKAGAYAVQAQAALFIEKLEGDYWNVVGLPVNLVYNLFRQIS